MDRLIERPIISCHFICTHLTLVLNRLSPTPFFPSPHSLLSFVSFNRSLFVVLAAQMPSANVQLVGSGGASATMLLNETGYKAGIAVEFDAPVVGQFVTKMGIDVEKELLRLAALIGAGASITPQAPPPVGGECFSFFQPPRITPTSF